MTSQPEPNQVLTADRQSAFYLTDAVEGGGGGFWQIDIECADGDFTAAEVYGDDLEQVSRRAKAMLAGLSHPVAAEGEVAGLWETARYLLWMMHARGPDDIYPAPNYETAVEWADRANTVGPEVKAVPALWLGTPESHAEGLPAAIAGWEVPSKEASK